MPGLKAAYNNSLNWAKGEGERGVGVTTTKETAAARDADAK